MHIYVVVWWHTMFPGTIRTLPLIPCYLPSDGLLLALPPKLSLSSLEPENAGWDFSMACIMVYIHVRSEANWNLWTRVALPSPHRTGAKWQNLLKRNGWKNMKYMKRKIHQHLQTCHLKPGALWDHQMILLPRLTPLGRSLISKAKSRSDRKSVV